jgi:hypothetical protein
LFDDGGTQTLKNIARPVQVWRWQPDEKLITAVCRALGENKALRFNSESLALFIKEKGRS